MSSETIIASVVSSLVTWFFAWLYYFKSSKDLKAEVKKLRLSSELSMKQADLIAKGTATDLKHDGNGNIVGIYANMSANIGGIGSLSAVGTLVDAQKDNSRS